MRILVTGGAGFIGSHMTASLLEQGHEVYVMDSLFCGSTENFRSIKNNKNFHFKQFDIVDLQPHIATLSTRFWDEKGPEHKFDQIYHMACPASPVTYQKDPVKTLLTNVVGTQHLLEVAKNHKARLLITSTSEVYGDPLQHPQKEEYWGNVNCTGIRSCYDEGKRAAETLCFDYHRTRGVDVRVARIFNTYGPNMMIDDGRIISNFVAQVLQSIPLTIYGSGKQTRSFCYISDQVRGLQSLMNQTKTIGPVNIGNPDEYTIMDVADKLKEILGAEKVKIDYKELPSDDPKQRKPDITKAKEFLNWTPTVPLAEGLKYTIEDFKRRLQN